MTCPQCAAAVGFLYSQTVSTHTTQLVCHCGWKGEAAPTTSAQLEAFERETVSNGVNAERGRMARRKKKAGSEWEDVVKQRRSEVIR